MRAPPEAARAESHPLVRQARDVDEAATACRVARLAAMLGIVGLAMDSMIWIHWIGTVPWSHMGSMAVLALLLVLLAPYRRKPDFRAGTTAFLICNAAIVCTLTTTSQVFAASGLLWVPFRPHHLGAMTVAVLAPPRLWVGVVTILAFTGAALVQFALFDPSIQARLPLGEPWPTLIYGVFSIVLLVDRTRRRTLAQAVLQARADAKAYEDLARTILAVRDLSNTPVQTLTLIVGLLSRRFPQPDELVARAENALQQLAELDRLLARQVEGVHWHAGSVSFDAKQVLEKGRRSTQP